MMSTRGTITALSEWNDQYVIVHGESKYDAQIVNPEMYECPGQSAPDRSSKPADWNIPLVKVEEGFRACFLDSTFQFSIFSTGNCSTCANQTSCLKRIRENVIEAGTYFKVWSIVFRSIN
jgi:hypothetical protein